MKLHELISHLHATGVSVQNRDGKLQVTSADGDLPDATLAALKKHKKDVAAYYAEPAPVDVAAPEREQPLSFAQRRLYFLYQYEPAATHFNLPMELGIEGALDSERLRGALLDVVQRHPIYRTTYGMRDGVPFQRVRSDLQPTLGLDDLRHLDAAAADERMALQRARIAATPFDLANELPLRMHLFRQGEAAYSLLIVFHHIATDEWSIQQLMRELSDAYRGTGPAAPVPAYGEYVAWQNSRHAGRGYEAARSYWTEHLADAEPVLALPADRARPSRQTYRTGLERLALPAALRERASQCAGRLGISEFALYLGLYQLLLHRLTGQRDLVVGTDVFGRDHGRFREVAGFFVNQLALRQQVPAGAQADEFLRQVARDVNDAMLFQDLPFDQLVDALQVERDPAYSPLFQVKFLYRRNSLTPDLFDGLRSWNKEMFAVQSQYDLTLQVLPDTVEAYFNPDLFDAARVAGWLELYVALAEEVVADPAQPLAGLLDARLRAMVAPFSHGEATGPAGLALCDRIASWAGATPERVAIGSAEGDLTYAELVRRMEAVAGQLAALGTGRGDKVAVYLDRSADLVVAVLAIARVGAVLVPLDTDNPPEHIAFVLHDSGANVVLSESLRADDIVDFYGLWLDIGALSAAPAPQALPAYDTLQGDDLVYQLYTSGSTGRPKGVLVTRAGFANLCDWYASFARIGPDSPVLLMIPIGFDASLKNIFTPLMQGATLVLAPAAPFDPDALLALIASRGVAVVNTAPSALYALLQQDAPRQYAALAGLTMFAVGGEALDLGLVRPWLDSPNCRALLANIYGPTECTDISLAFAADAATWLARATVTIGRPIRNTQAFIVNDELALCPPGTPGELVIAGCGVARGYHQLPDADARSFVHAALAQGRIYRTGDYACHEADGNVLYLGRRDGQIKIRGKRVETGEVLAQMARLLPGRTLSVQRYARDRVEMLVGFVAGLPSDLDSVQLRAELARHLPRHAVPADIVFVPSMPLSANGKIAAAALLALYEEHRSTRQSATRALSATEAAIAAIWHQLLGEVAVEADSSFFAVGGDSIFSIQLVAELQKLGYAVAVADIFKYPVLEQLAAFCDSRSHVAVTTTEALAPFALVDPADLAALPEGLEDAYPVTSLQQGMLFHCRMEPDSAMYHDVFSYELRFDYDAALLKQAVGLVLAHNQVLRTGFELDTVSEPLQLVYARVEPEWSEQDLRHLSAAEQEAAVATAIASLKRTGFALSGPSLIRFTVLRKAEGCIQLLIDAHHAILDGWSMATLQRQIFEHYGHLRFGLPLADVFDTGGLRFADYVAQQAAAEQDDAAAAHWRTYCRAAGSGALSARLPQQGEAVLHTLPLPADLPARLAQRVATDGVMLKTLLMMAHAYMLRALLPSERLSTALTDNGRPETPGAQNIVGLFVNVLPVAFDLDASWRQLAAALQADEVARKPFRRFPFAHIVREQRALQIDTLFTYNNFHVSEALQAAEWLQIEPGNSYEETNFKLAVLVNGNLQSGLTLTLESRLALTAAQVATLQREFVFALDCMAQAFDAPIPQRADRLLPVLAQAGAAVARLRWQGVAPAAVLEAALARCALRVAAIERAPAQAPFDIAASVEQDGQRLEWRIAPEWAQHPDLPALLSETMERVLATGAPAGDVAVACDAQGAAWPLRQLEDDMAFWRGRLAEAPAHLNLPQTLALAAGAERTDERHVRAVDTAALAALTARTGLSRGAILLGAWLALLARLSGQETVLTGVRLRAGGPLLPLVAETGDDPAATVLLTRAAGALQACAAHAGVPASLLPARHAAAFALADDGPLPADMAIVATDDGACRLELAADVHDAAGADRLAANLAELLQGAAAAPGERLSRLPLLGAAERHRVLVQFNDSAQHFDDTRQLHQMVEDQAAADPGALALLYGSDTMTYEVLNRRANQVAQFLHGHGIGANDRVAVCMERGLEMVVAILGVLKAGAAYMPLDPAYPVERIAYMLDDSAPRALLAQAPLLAALEPVRRLAAELPCLLLAEGLAVLDGLPDANPPAPPLAQAAANLMYVLYTSGSTGRPKGVAMAQGPLVNLIRWQASSRSKLAQRERTLQFSALGFDATFQEIFSALCYGASLVLLAESIRRDPRELVRLMRRYDVERIFLPFVALQNIAEAAVELGEPLPALNTMITAGEQLRISPAIVQFFRMRAGRSLHNYYGPTESHVVTTYVLDGDPGAWPALPPIGAPIANTQIYILDAALQPVALGAHGELYIAGDCLADGYLNRPDLTAERFVGNVFRPGTRMYKTGDIARWLEDGNIEYLGRNDSQVKIRGYRIEPGEVEAALAACAGVREAVVVAREDVPGQKRLVAYLLAQPGHTLAPAALRDRLATVLPDYMVPAAFVCMTAFPVSPNGKLDRRALPAPDAAAQLRQPYEAPQGSTETALAAIWEDLLAVRDVGRRDHFFELGGHSLLAVRLTTRVRQVLQRELALRALFEQPVLADLARVVDGLDSAGTAPLRALPRTPDQVLPLSFAQQRLWFVQELEGPTPTYNMPAALRLTGRLDAAALEAALQYLIERHEVLRTNFDSVEGVPHLRIAPSRTVTLAVTDVAPDEVEARAARHAALPFDLAREPLLRAELLRLSADQHVLLLNVHHIVSDGWSLNILADEWLRAYDALRAGRAPALPVLPLQYADYAYWQREQLTEAVRERQLAYWTGQLAGAPELLDLPTDRVRPAVQRFDGGDEQLRLDPALSHAVRQLGHAHNASLFMTLVTAFGLLLGRLSGQDDVLVGVPQATRDRRELEGMLGMLLGNLVLRMRLDDAAGFGTLLEQVRRTALEAYEHSAIPFEQVVDALPLQRDLSRNPLFQVFFNMLNLPETNYTSPELAIEGLQSTLLDAKFDLTLYAQDSEEGILLHLVYNRGLFDAQRMRELLRQYHSLLEQVSQAPAIACKAVSLLTAPARAVLPDPAVVLDATWHGSIPGRFAALVAAQPAALAVTAAHLQWTYAELDERSEAVACWLQEAGVGAGAVVAICAARRAALVPAVLGVLKAGAAYTIVDPAYPAEHVRACLAVARPAAWLTVAEGGDAALLACLPAPVPRLDLSGNDGWPVLAAGVRAVPAAWTADDVAVLTFTSGSTGLPKAVEGRHGALTHFYPWLQQHFGMGPQDRYALLSGLAHDPLQRDIFNTLWMGASLHVPPVDAIGPGLLADWMAAENISAVNLTPAMLQLLCQDARALPTLRHAFLVGDILTQADVALLQQVAPRCAVVSYYGATEAQRAFGMVEIAPGTAAGLTRDVIALGHGIPGVQLLVLNGAGTLAGIGEVGEVCIRSPHLARGYRDDAAMTARQFVANPFGGGDRLYRTGDLGRYLPDGMVAGLGRNDQQVKLRGFRIELGHVEAALARLPQVREAVVLALGSGEARRLVAYVVPRGTFDADAAAAALRGTLPDYMRPAAYVVLERLPLTPNGKLDRRALPAPAATPAVADTAPATALEASLCALMAELLNRDAVGPAENFFALGGHSLLATRLVSRIRAACGVQLPLRAVFEEPTPAALARLVERAGGDNAGPAPRERSGWHPLSSQQQRLWFLDRFEPANPFYNIPLALRLRGTLVPAQLQQSLDALAARHPSLRTRFATQDGQPVQEILAPAAVPLALTDLTGLAPAQREEAARRAAATVTLQPFVLEQGNLLRAALLRLDDADHVLVLVVHHIVSDGRSLAVLADELAALYRAGTTGGAAALPPLPLHYSDFAHWQRDWLQQPAALRQLAYWNAQLADAPAVHALPLDRPRPAIQSYRGATHGFAIGAATLAGLRELAAAQAEPTTLFMVLCAAFNVLLYRHSGQADLCIGTPIANRQHDGLDRVVGFFANTLVLRSRPAPGQPFQQFLRDVRATALDAYANQDIAFERVVEAVKPQRHTSHAPLFQVMLSLQESLALPQVDDTLRLEALTLDSSVARFDLTLSLVEEGGTLLAAFEYNTDLFDAATIERWAGHFSHLLDAVVATPQLALDRLPLLDDAERRDVLLASAGERAGPVGDTVLHALFEQQALAHPQRCAAQAGAASITYGELNTRAAELALRLRHAGVAAGDRVAVHAQRSLELLVALLGVLKAGAAYVPLDPAQPQERLAHMLRDSAPAAVLTQQGLAGGALLASVPCRVLLLDGPAAAAPAPLADVLVQPHDLAYVMYTSGSTGMPKGVMVEHASIVNTVRAHVRQCALQAQDRVLQFVSYGFDVSAGEIFGAFAAGATLVLRPDELRVPDEAFAAFLREQAVTVADLPAAFWHQWVHEIAAGRSLPGPALRLVLAGGEKADVARLRTWLTLPATRHVRWINAYGPTETTVNASYMPYDALSEPPAGEVPIGRPIDNTVAYVLDAHLQPVAFGIAGEIYLGGAGVARGYLNQPELTERAFVADPFAGGAARMYRSGDLGRRLDDGTLEYLGRNDSQVKLRGYRIELGEIQSRLATLDGVREACVMLREVAGTPRLVAYLAAAEGMQLSAAELRRMLAASLPDYMVPSAFVWLPVLPVNASGKVETAALPEPGPADMEARVIETPVGAREQLLAQIWQDLLALPQVSRQDHFFELGGHSLMVVTLIDRLHQHDLHVDVRTVFSSPTLAAMAAALADRAGATAAFVAPPNLIPGEFAASASTDQANFEEFEL
ncbi:amino acid adenylation domain-containing protein [[Empedobacter] haloabium]|uniref:Amino acid adenylation domain-containing protein n=1 Tax=[Empedobacter] haloabium TaxID=592317 RepID=A0ABZ1UHX4_9BURK